MDKTILLVDDDSGVRCSLTGLLQGEGYLVWPAKDGQEALELAAADPFDIAVLDLNMPRKNGWDTFERLTTENPLLPVIIITARSGQLFTALAGGRRCAAGEAAGYSVAAQDHRGLVGGASAATVGPHYRPFRKPRVSSSGGFSATAGPTPGERRD